MVQPIVIMTNIPPPLCVFCSAPWTDDMVKVFATAHEYHGYYESEIWVSKVDATIEINCSTCKRLVYKKELRDVSFETEQET